MAPPWKAMMTSQAVWAIIVAHFAENWGFYTLLTGLPMFMRGNFAALYFHVIHKLNLIKKSHCNLCDSSTHYLYLFC